MSKRYIKDTVNGQEVWVEDFLHEPGDYRDNYKLDLEAALNSGISNSEAMADRDGAAIRSPYMVSARKAQF